MIQTSPERDTLNWGVFYARLTFTEKNVTIYAPGFR